jgi:DNA invertase Pin-like site-specific DNA recombinase
MSKRAGIYARISSDRDGTELGVTRQLEDCRKLAATKAWLVVDEYVDNDVSAYSAKKRPEYLRLMDDLQSGRLGALVVYNADRLNRRPRDLEDLIDVCNTAGVRDLATVTGDIDLSTDQGRLAARLLGAVNANESEAKARRISRKHGELAANGKFAGGGQRPYGYEADSKTIRPDEAAAIGEAAARILAGDSLHSICRDFEERGIRTVSGKPWTLQTLRQILRSARISGQREHKGVIVAKAEWPAIIDPSTTAQLRALLDNPARRTNRTARRHLLTGVLVCGRCQAKLVARSRTGRRASYYCHKGVGFSGCGGICTVADPVEEWIIEAVLYRLDTPELAAALDGTTDRTSPTAAIATERDAEQARLNALADAYGADQIGLQEWIRARKPIEARIKAADRQLAAIRRTTVLDGFVGNSDRLRTTWDQLPLARQQAIIKAVLDRVVVMPSALPHGSKRFEHDRLQPTWRL